MKMDENLLAVFPADGMFLKVVHDDRDEGLGYYVDFEVSEKSVPSGCLYFSDDLNISLFYAKKASENFGLEDILDLDGDYDL